MHKRYLVFGITNYYPNGGLGDLENSYDTLEEAVTHVSLEREKKFSYSDYHEIYDRIEGKEIDF